MGDPEPPLIPEDTPGVRRCWGEGERKGDHTKATLATCLFFVMFVSVLAVSTILDGAGDTADLDDPSTQRRAVARWWGNETVDPCANFYNYSCQGYTRMAPPGLSVLGQTHVNVAGKYQPRPPNTTTAEIMRDLPSSIGIFPFYTVDMRWRNVYIYPIADDDTETAEGSDDISPRRKRRTFDQLSLQRVVTAPRLPESVVGAAGAIVNDTIATFSDWVDDDTISVWLVNDRALSDDVTDPDWFVDGSHTQLENISAEAAECMETQINASHHWSTMFYDPVGANIEESRVVEAVVERVVQQLRPQNTEVFAPIRVFVGGPDPPCTGMDSVTECLRWLWGDQLNLLRRNTSIFAPWPFSRLTTNAVYMHIDNAVYIPAGLVGKPFYDTSWNDDLMLASIGWIIAHEVCPYAPSGTRRGRQAGMASGAPLSFRGRQARMASGAPLSFRGTDYRSMCSSRTPSRFRRTRHGASTWSRRPSRFRRHRVWGGRGSLRRCIGPTSRSTRTWPTTTPCTTC